MAQRISAISPVARVPATWPSAREAGQPATPASPAPVAARPPSGGTLGDSTLGALPSMRPGLPPGLLAAATDPQGRQGGHPGQAPGAGSGETLPAPLQATQLPGEAQLLRAGSNPAAPLAAAWRALVLSGHRLPAEPGPGAPASLGLALELGLAAAAQAAGRAARGTPAVGGDGRASEPPGASAAPRTAPAPGMAALARPAGTPAWSGEPALPAWATAEFPSLALLPLAASQSMVPPPAAEPRLPALPTMGPDKLGFLLHAWNGQPVAMRLVEAEPEDPPPPPPVRGVPAMRLALDMPMLGRLVVQLQLAPGGVWMAMAVEQEAALPCIQAALPEFTVALAQAGLRLLRWRLERGAGHGAAFATPPLMLPPGPAALAPALFRAAAEVVLVLQQVDALVAADGWPDAEDG